jgi:hypothetical protein
VAFYGFLAPLTNQGDQIGQIFDQWAMFSLSSFFKITVQDQMLGAAFVHEKSNE